MRRTSPLLVALGVIALAGCSGGSSSLTPAGDPGTRAPQSVDSAATKLKCFSGTTDKSIYGGTCTLTSTGAILDTTGGNPNGAYAGVYIDSTNDLKFRAFSALTALSFAWSGSSANGADPHTGAGAPRFSIAYTNDNGATTKYAYPSGLYCNNPPLGAAATSGVIDVLNNNPCVLNTSEGGAPYPNWTAFVAAHPNSRLNGIPFVVSDEPNHIYTISKVTISK